ncbi:hypothetical protein V0288_03975 [Pannus brasiliensis CCIBt3594]|uniref:Uncharacterized protein n=1 Tax=Pannus brasiliensis CCIBt3594 TaxID=1427578 RepID=A0AAW9QQI4_9CHRO
MLEAFVLSPRYTLDDSDWLEGIDPSRRYWLHVNGDTRQTVQIPGLVVFSLEELRDVIGQFRSLQPAESLKIERIAESCTIHCVSGNCYAIEGRVEGALTWHLLDRETVESLLMSAHPDWIPSEKDIELGRQMLLRSLARPAYQH